jgi:hypothetical protein
MQEFRRLRGIRGGRRPERGVTKWGPALPGLFRSDPEPRSGNPRFDSGQRARFDLNDWRGTRAFRVLRVLARSAFEGPKVRGHLPGRRGHLHSGSSS